MIVSRRRDFALTDNMKDQVLDEVIENDLLEIKIEQGAIEREVSAMKEQFL